MQKPLASPDVLARQCEAERHDQGRGSQLPYFVPVETKRDAQKRWAREREIEDAMKHEPPRVMPVFPEES